MEKEKKDLEYWKNNAEEGYITTPISVLRYISELEKAGKGAYESGFNDGASAAADAIAANPHKL
jgi:hypothetical protein